MLDPPLRKTVLRTLPDSHRPLGVPVFLLDQVIFDDRSPRLRIRILLSVDRYQRGGDRGITHRRRRRRWEQE